MPWIDPERVADDVLLRSGTPRQRNGIAIDVERILRNRHDVDIAEVPDVVVQGQKLAGLFASQYSLVIVEAKDIVPRRRFTLAHELGHIELHYKNRPMEPLFAMEAEPLSYRCTEKDLEGVVDDARRRLREVSANKFAAALLMPVGLVREIWKKHRDEAQCARDLDVSLQAFRIRLPQALAARH